MRFALSFAFPAALCALSILAPREALANGRFPIADHLTVDPNDPSHLVLRTTYGILETSNAGTSWAWICEGAVGYGGTQDPAMAILGDGTVLAGLFEGLGVTHDRGCSWAMAEGPLKGEYIIDVSTQKDDPSRGVAITSTGTGSGFHVIVAETTDNGVTWTQAGNAILSDFIALTIDVAPSDPQRIYASGLVGKALAPAIERSDDRGMTWTRTYLDPIWAEEVPFLSAIDPTNPDRLYVRLSGDPIDRLIVSDDGGATFTEIYTGQDDLLGFALSPDGTRVAVGGPKDGIRTASTVDHVFTQTSSIYTRCLTWAEAGLYACGNEFTDMFTLALSQDEGKTFTPLYHLKDICPIECPEGAPTPPACVQMWPPLASTLGIPAEQCGGNSTSSSSSSGGTPPVPLDGGGGCECGVDRSSESASAALLASLCAIGFARSRRRR
jgi:hypothetical protein